MAALPGAGSRRATRISPPHCGQLCVSGGAFEKSERAMVSLDNRIGRQRICNIAPPPGKVPTIPVYAGMSGDTGACRL
jgi:hypothetical protein